MTRAALLALAFALAACGPRRGAAPPPLPASGRAVSASALAAPDPRERLAAYVAQSTHGETLADTARMRALFATLAAEGFGSVCIEAQSPDGGRLFADGGLVRTIEEARATGLRVSLAYAPLLAPPDALNSWMQESAQGERDGGRARQWSPAIPDVYRAILAEWDELLASGPDEVLLVGVRWSGPHADIGVDARAAFERWFGVETTDWPAEVLPERARRGPLAPAWVAWRAQALRDLVAGLRERQRAAAPRMRLALLVDGHYPAHLRGGLNWAAPRSSGEMIDYGETGAGHLVDDVVLGLWAPGADPRETAIAGYSPGVNREALLSTARELLPPATGMRGALFLDDLGPTGKVDAAKSLLEGCDGLLLLPPADWVAELRGAP
ncbi:MAG: hypothetical protein SF028_12590 [Candidatus Sumerlaeia bacterium]|nr:hypothetical protein [Candidatus Sumerlaeia bacterium]